jgi:hypothetical protein
MKKTLLPLIILLISFRGFAQRDMRKNNVDLHIGISPSFVSIPITNNGLSNMMISSKLGVCFYDRKDEMVLPAWTIGLYGTLLSPQANLHDVSSNRVEIEQSQLRMRDAGIYFEIVPYKTTSGDLFSDNATQFYVSLPFQWGLLSDLAIFEHHQISNTESLVEESDFMKFEPGINLNLRVSKFAIFTIGASYQWTYLWNKPLENVKEWPDLGIFKLNLGVGVRISLFE